jgi:hypothetical protein
MFCDVLHPCGWVLVVASVFYESCTRAKSISSFCNPCLLWGVVVTSVGVVPQCQPKTTEDGSNITKRKNRCLGEFASNMCFYLDLLAYTLTLKSLVCREWLYLSNRELIKFDMILMLSIVWFLCDVLPSLFLGSQ